MKKNLYGKYLRIKRKHDGEKINVNKPFNEINTFQRCY